MNLIKQILLFYYLLLSIVSVAQPCSSWLRTVGNDDKQVGMAIVADKDGYSYTTGMFEGLINLGSTTLNSIANTANYMAKYDEYGSPIWAKKVITGAYNTRIEDMIIDTSENIIVAGNFYGNITVDTISLTSTGGSKLFFAKFNKQGNVIWAKQITITYPLYFNSIALANDNGFFITIRNRIYKFDTNGNLVWTKLFVNTNYITLKQDSLNNIFISGNFNSTLTIDGITVNANTTNAEMFLAKLDENGVAQWIKKPFCTNTNNGVDIALDNLGNCYVSGSFKYIIHFDSYIFSAVNTNGFIAKYDSLGNVLWAKKMGGANQDYAVKVACNSLGYVYARGVSSSTSFYIDGISINISGMFLAKFSDIGNVIWAKGYNTHGGEDYYDLFADNKDNIYITGCYNSAGSIETAKLTHAGSGDAYFGKIDSSGILFDQRYLVLPDDKTIFCGQSTNYFGVPSTFQNPNYGFLWTPNYNLTSDTTATTKASPLHTTTYTVNVTSTSGCVVKDSITINVDTGTILSDFSYSVLGNTIYFNHLAIGQTTYLWGFGDGGISTLANPSHTYTSNGVFEVCLTASNPCISDIYCDNVIITTNVGIAEFSYEYSVVFKPNYFTESTIIEILSNKLVSNESFNAIIYDVAGRVQKKVNYLQLGENVFNAEKLSSGLYFYDICLDENIISKGKFIIR
jgi:PKD repeat protein